MLVSTAELAENLSNPKWVIFDCRHDLGDAGKGRIAYGTGHIAGAYFAAVDGDLSGEKTGSNGRHPLPQPEQFTAFLARHGIAEDSRVVAYDDVGGQYAARLWWVARWIGFDRVSLLDGGWAKWDAEGRAVYETIPEATGGSVVAKTNDALLVKVAEVEANLDMAARVVVDARAPERYRGEVEPLDRVAGHIPGALNHGFKQSLNDDLTMKSPDELKAAFGTLLGDRKPTEVIHQCGSGITACVNLLAMERAGLSGSKLYAGSWSEWSSDPARPVATG
jgi:thiosulfate/3-mercaptopyruvate sulfurtransferase